MAKRPRFSRWRRLPGVFRTGEHRPPDTGTELDRIILYVPARILDLAEALAEKAGVASVQDYCALLLMQGLENERVQQKVAEFEARRGPLEGLKQIADDPQYLAEWQRALRCQNRTPRATAPTTTSRLDALGPGEPVIFIDEPLLRAANDDPSIRRPSGAGTPSDSATTSPGSSRRRFASNPPPASSRSSP